MATEMTSGSNLRQIAPLVERTPKVERQEIRPEIKPVEIKAAQVNEQAKLEKQEYAKQVEKTAKASEQLNQVMESFNKDIRFKVHEDSGQVYAQIIDKKTHEVVRTIPSEDMLEHMARLNEVIGMFLDTEV